MLNMIKNIKFLSKVHIFKEYLNDVFVFSDFKSSNYRLIKLNKRLYLKILLICASIEFIKNIYHGFVQNNLHRIYFLDFVTTFNE